MKSQNPPPFRPLFLLGIGLVVLGKLITMYIDREPIMWTFVVIGLIVTVIDIFRWFNQDAVDDVRKIKGPKA